MSLGLRMDYKALFVYWQYLDVESLKHNLLPAVWYDHAQPPFFNLLLGVIVKISGTAAPVVFEVFFKLITLVNCCLLLTILKKVSTNKYIPVVITLAYMLSPGVLIFETELFYTTFISLLMLISTYFLFAFDMKRTMKNSLGIFIPLALLCLTRSMYHLLWLVPVSVITIFYYKNKTGFRQVVIAASIAVFLVTGWYIKNQIIFHSFGSSTWIGMNLARNVFHDNEIADSTQIMSIEPFSKISLYKNFIPEDYDAKFRGLNDRDLLQEFKNDSFVNENHVEYIEISKKYLDASKSYIKSHPTAYVQNVFQSGIIFFTSAAVYPFALEPSKKILYYDILAGFNLTHFAKDKQQRRILLTISAVPKLLLYFFVFGTLVIHVFNNSRRKFFELKLPVIIIACTIGFVFIVSSLLEHFENMRFRYEIEPLFLILLGLVIQQRLDRKKSKPTNGLT